MAPATRRRERKLPVQQLSILGEFTHTLSLTDNATPVRDIADTALPRSNMSFRRTARLDVAVPISPRNGTELQHPPE